MIQPSASSAAGAAPAVGAITVANGAQASGSADFLALLGLSEDMATPSAAPVDPAPTLAAPAIPAQPPQLAAGKPGNAGKPGGKNLPDDAAGQNETAPETDTPADDVTQAEAPVAAARPIVEQLLGLNAAPPAQAGTPERATLGRGEPEDSPPKAARAPIARTAVRREPAVAAQTAPAPLVTAEPRDPAVATAGRGASIATPPASARVQPAKSEAPRRTDTMTSIAALAAATPKLGVPAARTRDEAPLARVSATATAPSSAATTIATPGSADTLTALRLAPIHVAKGSATSDALTLRGAVRQRPITDGPVDEAAVSLPDATAPVVRAQASPFVAAPRAVITPATITTARSLGFVEAAVSVARAPVTMTPPIATNAPIEAVAREIALPATEASISTDAPAAIDANAAQRATAPSASRIAATPVALQAPALAVRAADVSTSELAAPGGTVPVVAIPRSASATRADVSTVAIDNRRHAGSAEVAARPVDRATVAAPLARETTGVADTARDFAEAVPAPTRNAAAAPASIAANAAERRPVSADANAPIPAVSADPAPAIVNAATPPAAPAPTAPAIPAVPAAPTPHDFATLVDRLSEAREAAQPHLVRTAMNHAEFGQVSMQFRADDARLSVTLTGSDPGLAPAVQAAAAASIAAGTDRGSDGAPRQDAQPQGQQPQAQTGANAGSQQQTQPRADRDTPREQHQQPASGRSRADRSAQDDTPARPDRRGGIYA